MSERAKRLIDSEWTMVDGAHTGDVQWCAAALRTIERLLCDVEAMATKSDPRFAVIEPEDTRRRQRERLEDRMDRGMPVSPYNPDKTWEEEAEVAMIRLAAIDAAVSMVRKYLSPNGMGDEREDEG